jgi:hypothetical protein
MVRRSGSNLEDTEDLKAKFGAAWYDFQKHRGRAFPRHFVPHRAERRGQYRRDASVLRPARQYLHGAAQHHPTAANGFGTTNQWQYYGLATPFQVLTLTGRLEYDAYDPVKFALTGEF